MTNNNKEKDKLKRILYKNKFLLLFILVSFLIFYLSFVYYKHHLSIKNKKASIVYSNILLSMENKDLLTAKNESIRLMDTYKGTVYSQLSSMILAKIFIIEGNAGNAEKYLRISLLSKNKYLLYHISIIRLSRLMHSEGNSMEALNLLNDNKVDSYKIYYDLTFGDIYFDLNNFKQSNFYYLSVYNNISENEIPPYLKLKLMALGNIRNLEKFNNRR